MSSSTYRLMEVIQCHTQPFSTTDIDKKIYALLYILDYKNHLFSKDPFHGSYNYNGWQPYFSHISFFVQMSWYPNIWNAEICSKLVPNVLTRIYCLYLEKVGMSGHAVFCSNLVLLLHTPTFMTMFHDHAKIWMIMP